MSLKSLWRAAKIIATISPLLILITWVALSPRFSPSLYEKYLFHPEYGCSTPEELHDLESYREYPNHEVFFQSKDGIKLQGWLFEQPGRTGKVILLNPGNAGDIGKRLSLVRLLLYSGANVFVYEYRGFGKSEGKPTFSGVSNDGLAAYDFLIKQGYSSDRIVLYGLSMGSSVASYVSTQRRHAGLVLESGFYSLARISKLKAPEVPLLPRRFLPYHFNSLREFVSLYPNWLFPRNFDSASVVEGSHQPLLVMHGVHDEVIPFQQSVDLFRRASGKKSFVEFVCPDSLHASLGQGDQIRLEQAVTAFLHGLN